MTQPDTIKAVVTMGHGKIKSTCATTCVLDEFHERQAAPIAKTHTGNTVAVPQAHEEPMP